MRIFSLFLCALLSTTAHASQLDDGFRGRKFGSSSILDFQPLEHCQENPEKGVRWRCHTTIADVPVKVSYMASEGIFYGLLIMANGYSAKVALLNALRAAWGPGLTDSLDEGLWQKKPFVASLEYNRFNGEVQVVWYNDTLLTEMKNRRKKQAAEAVKNGL